LKAVEPKLFKGLLYQSIKSNLYLVDTIIGEDVEVIENELEHRSSSDDMVAVLATYVLQEVHSIGTSNNPDSKQDL
jgi:hypothetical protein